MAVAEADVAQQVDPVVRLPVVRAQGVGERAVRHVRQPEFMAGLRIGCRPVRVIQRQRRAVPVLRDSLVGLEVTEHVFEPVARSDVPASIEDVHVRIEESVLAGLILEHVIAIPGLRRGQTRGALVIVETEQLVRLRHVLDGIRVLVLFVPVVAVVELQVFGRPPQNRRADREEILLACVACRA